MQHIDHKPILIISGCILIFAISILYHLCPRAVRFFGSTTEYSPKRARNEYGLVEGLGTISHVLCVVVAGETQLFITLRRQLLRSGKLRPLLRKESHSPQSSDVSEMLRQCSGLSFSSVESFENQQLTPTTEPLHPTGETYNTLRDVDEGCPSPMRKSRSHVVISSSPPFNHSTIRNSRRSFVHFPEREATEKIKYPHFDLDSRLKSVSSSLHIDDVGGTNKSVLMSSQRQRHFLKE